MNVHFVSLGCPKNRVDTEVMLGHTVDAGHQPGRRARGADVIVVNTCGVHRRGQGGVDRHDPRDGAHKEAGTCSGWSSPAACRSATRTELANEMPEVDHFLGSDEVGAIAKAHRRQHQAPSRVADTPAYLYDDCAAPRGRRRAHSAYVKIAEGCDRPCAFCIIPKLRGPQRSRAIRSGRRARRASSVAGGVVEINLIAQDLTTLRQGPAGRASRRRATLASLLRQLAASRRPGAGSACTTRIRARSTTSCST